MTDYVIMPGTDYQSICDAVREKTGGTDLLKSGDVAGRIQTINTGGASWITIVEEQEITVTNNSKYGCYTIELDVEAKIVQDNWLYLVKLDDTEYYACSYVTAGKMNGTITAGMYVVGNNSIAKKTMGYTFSPYIEANEDLPFQVTYSQNPGTSITVCTSDTTETTHKFAMKKIAL